MVVHKSLLENTNKIPPHPTPPLLLIRSYLHLHPGQRVTVAFPRTPLNSHNSRGAVRSVHIFAREAGFFTAIEPPASLGHLSAVGRRLVVVVVFSGEFHTIVVRKGVSRITCHQEMIRTANELKTQSLKGPLHKDFAVSGQFCAKNITYCL